MTDVPSVLYDFLEEKGKYLNVRYFQYYLICRHNIEEGGVENPEA